MNKLKTFAFVVFIVANILMDGVTTIRTIREQINQPRVIHIDTTRRVERPLNVFDNPSPDSIERPPNWRETPQCIPNTDLNGDGQDDFCAKTEGGHP